MEERVQKILAQAGLGSRRSCEELILKGRVAVNGVTIDLGSKADPAKDSITVDRNPIPVVQPNVYVALYKPRMVLSDREPSNDDRTTVHDLVPDSGNLFAVGRLDFESEGLILLTNDGELKNQLTHPRYGHEKEYRVLVASRPDNDQLEKFQRGVVLEDGHRTGPAKVFVESIQGKGAWLRVVVTEGHKRIIRETCRTLGLPVVRLVRVRIATLTLGRLRPKEFRYLTEDEVAGLRGEMRPLVKRQVSKNRPRGGVSRSYPRSTRASATRSGGNSKPGGERRAGSRPNTGDRRSGGRRPAKS